MTACPFDVLSLFKNESGKKVAKVVNFDSCNECDDCVKVCKPRALTRRAPGEPLPMLDFPELDAHFMSNLPGLYLIGEVSGASLVRNANNLGARTVMHLEHRGLERPAGSEYDVIIIGAGPGGLSAGITAAERGLRHLVIEQDETYLTILREVYPKGKEIQNQPAHIKNIGPLPMDGWSVQTKEAFLERCDALMAQHEVNFAFNAQVSGVQALSDGSPATPMMFKVTVGGQTYTAENVIIAIGTRGKPRTLSCEGYTLPHIKYHLIDPALHQAQAIAVVGGGNSALEAAIAVAQVHLESGFHQSGAQVHLIYRKGTFSRASDRNIGLLKDLELKGALRLHLSSQPVTITQRVISVETTDSDGARSRVDIPCEAVYCMLGAEAPMKWLTDQGVEYIKRPQGWSPSPSDDLSFLSSS